MRFVRPGALSVIFVLGLGARTVSAQCSVMATDIVFGAYDVFSPVGVLATGTVTVDCDLAPPPDVIIQIGPSANSGGFNPRQMKHATGPDRLNYNLFTDSTRTTVWGDGTSGTGTVTCERVVSPRRCTKVVYAWLPAGQDVSVGAYQDVVTVTIVVVPKK